jgi:hypothetical protein
MSVVASSSWPARPQQPVKRGRRYDELIRAAVVDLLGDDDKPPIYFGPLLGKLGISSIQYRGGFPHSGALVREPNGDLKIVCSADQPPARKRFTIAHEVAHAYLDRFRPTDAIDDVEAFCDRFAAELLMPSSQIQPEGEDGLSVRRLAELTDLYKVSLQTIAIRVAELTEISILLADRDQLVWAVGPIRDPDPLLIETSRRAIEECRVLAVHCTREPDQNWRVEAAPRSRDRSVLLLHQIR